MPRLRTRFLAEALGTFWLVFGGCGSAVLSAAFPELGIGFVGVSLAFGLTVLTMAYSIGHISGCHLNPAVTFGLWVGGRFPARDIPPYFLAQLLGAALAAATLYLIASCCRMQDRHSGIPSIDKIPAPAICRKAIYRNLHPDPVVPHRPR